MPVPPLRRRPIPLLRHRTLLAGAALGGLLLLVLGVLGGSAVVRVGPATAETTEAPRGSGPLTAVQPDLRPALLPGPTPEATSPAPTTATPPPATPPPSASPELGRLSALCRALFEDPAELPELLGTLTRQQRTGKSTADLSGSLRQVLNLFDPEQAPTVYQLLRDTTDQCGEFAATLPDGTPVTVWLRQVATPEQDERVDEAYTAEFTAQAADRTVTGWLAVDRLGPVVSMLHALAPDERAEEEVAQERQTLRQKVRRKLADLLSGLWPTASPTSTATTSTPPVSRSPGAG